MDQFVLESGHAGLNKHGETLCGDHHYILSGDGRTTAVLSDGLGSGVKANILATLTSKMLTTLLRKRVPIDEAIETVADTLPMCRERRLAYATFTALELEENVAYLAQYDNPRALLLRDGKKVDYPTRVRYVGDKEIHESRIPLQEGDILILMTDGVTNAGVGKVAPNGWPRAEVAALVESIYTPETSAQYLAASVASAARALALEQPDDDITVLAFRYRARRAVSMMIGPPENECDDDRVLRQFFAKESAHVVCGGTTATLVANYLGRELVTILETQTAELPAIGAIEGVDLVTEGVITLRKVVENAELLLQNGMNILPLYGKRDGASLLSHLLFEEATDLSIFFGTAVNPAHDALDIDFQSKLALVKRLEELLTQMGKRVKVSLC